MNRRKAILSLLGAGLSADLLRAQAQEATQPKPVKHELQLILMADSRPLEFVLVIGHLGFKSLSSPALHEWITNLPASSVIEYQSSDRRIGGEPTAEELAAFQNYCKSKSVKFVIMPGG